MKLFGNSHSRRVDPENLNVEEWDDSEALDTEEEEEEEEVRERRGLPSGAIMAISAFAVLLLVAGAGALIVNYFLDLINYQAADSEYFATVQTEEELPEETAINEKLAAIDEEEAGLEATPEELAQWQAQIDNIVSDDDTYEVPISADVYNILLIGSDTRVQGEVGRSDAMILVSINQKTKRIYLTSFLRDCYVYLPGWGHTRLNHAFAYEGPALLEQTLEENFKVHVDKYVAVDFFSFMDVVDTLGGPVRLEVSDILYVEVMGHYLSYETKTGSFRVRGSMKEHEPELKKHGFARSHKSYVVNLANTENIQAGELTVCGRSVPLGRAYKDSFLAAYMQYLRG